MNDESGFTAGSAIELLTCIGLSLSFSSSSVELAGSLSLGAYSLSLGLTLSYDLLFGRHGLVANYEEEDDDNQYVGADMEASAVGLGVIALAYALFAFGPVALAPMLAFNRI